MPGDRNSVPSWSSLRRADFITGTSGKQPEGSKPAVSPSQPGSWALPLHHGQLVPEGKILESQFLDTRRANEKTKD